MTVNLIQQFLDKHTYDIRVSRNGRWIDQKCTFDAVCFVADCIMDYIDNGGKQPFQSPDIWRSDYASENVQRLFCKPDPGKWSAHDEYNKFFRQPMKMLAAAGILVEDGRIRNTIQFRVSNVDILRFIALRERNSFDFLCLYIEKTLKDSGLWDSFATFLDEQTKVSLSNLKDDFTVFCFENTPIKNVKETGRIFSKVLNPLACKYHKKGIVGGRLAPSNITFDKLMYNKTNWRDDALGKDKNVPRGDFVPAPQATPEYDYRVQRAMRNLRRFNERYNSGESEIVDRFSVGEKASAIHHIFPQNEFPALAAFLENLIALTGGQHYQKAHPNGNTSKIDKDYQYLCLINKTAHIRKNLLDNQGEPVIYDFYCFMYVLDIGLNTDYFEALPLHDFDAVLTGIECNF